MSHRPGTSGPASSIKSTRPPLSSRRTRAPRQTTTVTPSGRKLTVEEIIADLGISQRTFYRWKKAGKGPKTFPLPGGRLRVWESVYESWLADRERGGAQ